MNECEYHRITPIGFYTYMCDSCHAMFTKLPSRAKDKLGKGNEEDFDEEDDLEDDDDLDASGV